MSITKQLNFIKYKLYYSYVFTKNVSNYNYFKSN